MLVDIDEYAEGAVMLTGLEKAVIGIGEDFGSPGRKMVYSKQKILDILQERDLMTSTEAEEFYDYNIVGLYAGEQNPIFLDLEIIPIKNDVLIASYETQRRLIINKYIISIIDNNLETNYGLLELFILNKIHLIPIVLLFNGY